MKDVLTLVRRFGALCGRPSRFEGPGGFDYSLFLHAVSAEKLSEVESTLREMFPGASPVPALPSAAPPPPPPTPAPVPASPPPTPAPPAPIPAPEPSGAQIKMEPTPAPLPPPPRPLRRHPFPLPRCPPAAVPAAVPAQARPPRPLWGLRFHWIPSGIRVPPGRGLQPFRPRRVHFRDRLAREHVQSLFLYGPAGVGKSHMIAAIGAGLKKASRTPA